MLHIHTIVSGEPINTACMQQNVACTLFFAVYGDVSKITTDNTTPLTRNGNHMPSSLPNDSEMKYCPHASCDRVFPTQTKLELHLSQVHSTSSTEGSATDEDLMITSMKPPSKTHKLFQVHSSGVLLNPNIEIVESLDDSDDSSEKQSVVIQGQTEIKDPGMIAVPKQVTDNTPVKSSNGEILEPARINKSNKSRGEIHREDVKEESDVTTHQVGNEAMFACHLCQYKSQELRWLKIHYHGRHPSVELPDSPDKRPKYQHPVHIKPRPFRRKSSEAGVKCEPVEVDGKF